jgi:methylmalonyl-CoA mutase
VSPAPDLESARERWRGAVAGVLAKSRPEAAGVAEPERLLDSPTYDGFAVHPLYTALDGLPEWPLPGDWPFVRGADPRRDVLSGWKVAERFPRPGQPVAEANAAVLAALVDGVSALDIRVGPDGVATGDLARLLDGVYLDLAPVMLDSGDQFAAAAEVMVELVAGVDEDRRAAIAIDLGADPLTAGLSGRPAPAAEEVAAVAAGLAGRPEVRNVRAVTVDGPALHGRGASAGWELGASIAAGAEYLRLLTEAGLPTADALHQVSFRLAADGDQFMTIAKFRAARRLWARVGEVLGCPGDAAARLHALTSPAMMTQRDPWVNMLRTTVAAFGAGIGGAATVRVLPFDAALPGGYPGHSADFARRIARNSQLLLLEESHIGRVLDPAGGSWYVEQLTETLAGQAWSVFQQIESRGGLRQAGDHLSEQIDLIRARQDEDVAHRRKAITGVSEFPDLNEPSPARAGERPPGWRPAVAFEALRDRSDVYLQRAGARPRALLLPLGPPAENTARATFAVNMLAAGGVEAVDPGTVDPAGAAAAVRAAGTPVAVICGTDARYATEAAATVIAAREAGCEFVYLAGPSSAVAGVAPADRPDRFLTARINAVEALDLMLTRLGA